MKPQTIEAKNQDRLATLEEIRHATSSSPDRLLQLAYSQGNFCETSSDFAGIIRYPAEEFELFACLSDPDADIPN